MNPVVSYLTSLDGAYTALSLPAYEGAKLAQKYGLEIGKWLPITAAVKDVAEITQCALSASFLGNREVVDHAKAFSIRDLTSMVNLSFDFLTLANACNKTGRLAVKYVTVIANNTKVCRVLAVLRPFDNVFFLAVFGKKAFDSGKKLYQNSDKSIIWEKENRKELCKLILFTSVAAIGVVSYSGMVFQIVAESAGTIIDRLDTSANIFTILTEIV